MRKMNNIILIGYMGSGKTSVGKLLAKTCKYQFCDTDEIIEKNEGERISEIFEAKGESHFRMLETQTLEQLQGKMKRCVLSTGGGMPCSEVNAGLLKSIGTVFYLKVSKDIVLGRLQGDTTRPLLQNGDLEEKVEQMLKLRDPLYERAADVIIQTDTMSVKEIVNEVMKQVEQINGTGISTKRKEQKRK